MSEQIKGRIKVGCGKNYKNFLVETDEYGEIWIPKGQVDWPKNHSIKIWISDWIAWKKEIITEEEFNSRQGNRQKKEDELPF